MSDYSLPLTYINGQQVNSLSILDRGLAYGDGLFETMLVVNGLVPLLSYHHQRLLKGLSHLGIQLDSDRLVREVNKLLGIAKTIGEKQLILKLIVTRGVGGRGYQIDNTASATLILQLFTASVDRSKYNGVNVHVCRQKLFPVSWAGLKTLNQLSYVLAAKERAGSAFDEGLLLNNDGDLIEATARNVFIVKGEQLYTPVLNTSGVAGAQRQFIIESVAGQLGLDVIEKIIKFEECLSADEVFLTNSITGIWPVTACEYRGRYYEWNLGAVTRSLQAMCHGVFFEE